MMRPRGIATQFAAVGRRVRPLAAALLDLFFPPRCVQCHTLGNRLCAACRADVVWIDSDRCRLCGLPAGGTRPHACIDTATLAFVRSAAVYGGPIRKALHALKYQADRLLADQLTGLCAEHWALPKEQFDLLVPVPLGRRRESARGYNQSRLLAEALSRRGGIPVGADRLARSRETKSQVVLSHAERRENVAGAFAARNVAGISVLLIDDVCTTGATLQSCAEALVRAGALRVGAVTLARAALPPREHRNSFQLRGGSE
jgi:ComF family protein